MKGTGRGRELTHCKTYYIVNLNPGPRGRQCPMRTLVLENPQEAAEVERTEWFFFTPIDPLMMSDEISLNTWQIS